MLVAVAAAGLLDSAYLTANHYSTAPLACAQNAVVDCDLVTRSSYGFVPGTAIPVSALGILWFAVSLGLSLRERSRATAADRLLFAWAVAGLLVVFYLVWAELRLHRLCEYCTLAHALVVATALVAAGRLAATTSPSGSPGRGAGAPPP